MHIFVQLTADTALPPKLKSALPPLWVTPTLFAIERCVHIHQQKSVDNTTDSATNLLVITVLC